jgi:hypothetical protein
MLVKVLQFGSNWWARFGQESDGPGRYTRRAAYYNSTGIPCGRTVRRHWIVPGLIRFNAAGGFNPHLPYRAIGATFLCSELTFLFGGNRLLFRNQLPKTTVPDCYLVVLSSDIHGAIRFSSERWTAATSGIIAASHLRERQEAMLLMKAGDWVETCCGFWCLSPCNGNSGMRLELQREKPRD